MGRLVMVALVAGIVAALAVIGTQKLLSGEVSGAVTGGVTGGVVGAVVSGALRKKADK